jgi:colanic acid biosynthesis glycosyl transferase WcaI
MGVTARLEGAALNAADAVAIVTEAFRAQVESYGVPPDRVSLLPNWSHVAAPRRDRMAMRRLLAWPDNVTVLLHTGNMGLKQDLGNVIEAARLSQDRSDLLWVLMGDGSQRAQLSAQARSLRNVVFLSPCEPEDYGDVLAAADILLVNERATVGDMSLPSKLTSYFLSGRPVVAAVSRGGATSTELERAGAAVTAPAGRPELLLERVLAIGAQPNRARRMGENGRRHADRHLTAHSAMSRLDRLLSVDQQS